MVNWLNFRHHLINWFRLLLLQQYLRLFRARMLVVLD